MALASFVAFAAWFAPVHGSAQELARHTPPSDVAAERDLTLEVDVSAVRRVKSIRLRFRRAGEQRYQKQDGQKKSGRRWAFRLSSAVVKPPYLEYFIIAQTKDGKANLVFASPQKPHRLAVTAALPKPVAYACSLFFRRTQVSAVPLVLGG